MALNTIAGGRPLRPEVLRGESSKALRLRHRELTVAHAETHLLI